MSHVQPGAPEPLDHHPVMVVEVVDLFRSVPPGILVDVTVGRAGHAVALLQAHPHLHLLGIDRDPSAVQVASSRLERFGPRAKVIQARFDQVGEVLSAQQRARGWARNVSGVLFDLGVSSPQIDDPGRGFSYRFDSPLDMRMDPGAGPRASDLVNSLSIEELAEMFAKNGEQRFAWRLAHAVAAARPIRTTAELVAVVDRAVPVGSRRSGHRAKRVFQALRIAVNEELDQLTRALPQAIGLLAPGGRCVAIAYHSGEDRIVKAAFADAVSGGCRCPAGLPCACGAVPLGRLIKRGAARPSPAEVGENPRSKSARLRAIERLG